MIFIYKKYFVSKKWSIVENKIRFLFDVKDSLGWK